MKSVWLLFLLAILPAYADDISLEVGPKGAVIKGGVIGDFILEGPNLALEDKTTHTPTLVAGADGVSYTLKYDTGFEIHAVVSKENKTVSFDFGPIPDKGQFLQFSMYVPMSFNQGGKLAVDGKPPVVIPDKQGGQFVEEGSVGEFDLISAFGQGISIKMPVSWQGFQDNRVFNWEIYVWDYNYDLKANPNEHNVVFTFGYL